MSYFENDSSSHTFDEDETYHPVFCVTDVPDEYFDEFNEHASENEVPWLEITTSDPSKILEELRNPEREESSSESSFLGWNVERIYQFYNQHVRPKATSTGRGEHFTTFTFAIVDDECVRKREVILCCDAPDFGEREDEVKLKTIRVSLPQGIANLGLFEQLSLTPSESLNPGIVPLKMQPIPTMQAVEKKPGDTRPGHLYRIATPYEARRNKRQGIMQCEAKKQSYGS